MTQFPGTIIESMLLGLPVISYNTGGIPDLNRNGENVILVEQGDKDKLSAEIIKLLKNPGKAKKPWRKSTEISQLKSLTILTLPICLSMHIMR